MGPRATEGCYIEGGTFKGYIEEEIGLYLDERAEIRWPDRTYSLFKLKRIKKIEKQTGRLLVSLREEDGALKYIGFPPRLFQEDPSLKPKGPPRISVALGRQVRRSLIEEDVEIGMERIPKADWEADSEILETTLDFMVNGDEEFEEGSSTKGRRFDEV